MNDQDLCPLPSHPRTVRVEPHTGIAAWPLETGDELIVKNESGVKIEVEAGTLSHGRVERISELERERDALLNLLVSQCDGEWVAHWIVMSEDDATVGMEANEVYFNTQEHAIARIRKAAGLDGESEAGE